MSADSRKSGTPKELLKPTSTEWGQKPEDHFGYGSDEERRTKRGLEDWELLDKIPTSQHNVPVWFIAVIVVVLLVAVGLSFPFWGDRPGYERAWFDWGFAGAIVYVIVGSVFVYFMMRLYGTEAAGRAEGEHSAPRQSDDDINSSAR